MKTWQIGEVRITQVVELGGNPVPPTFLFPDATPERVLGHRWLRPHFANDEGRLFASIHSFVVESAGRRIIVDTCVGNGKTRSVKTWHQRQGPFLDDLAAAGFAADTIDTVLCTHLHVDHVGWNTRWVDGKWVPTFPKARYLFGRVEWEHWSLESKQDSDASEVVADSVRPIVDAGLCQLVEMNHRLTPQVWLEPTPGHTPGHVSVRIESAGMQAVITGDLMHHPIQCCEPDLASNFDVDAAAARRTRRDFLSRHSNQPVLVLGTHFAPPTAGWIVPAGDVWQFSVEPAQAPPTLQSAPSTGKS